MRPRTVSVAIAVAIIIVAAASGGVIGAYMVLKSQKCVHMDSVRVLRL